jgi:tripartite-type tricarboxylate transporter receptor subunit TctC
MLNRLLAVALATVLLSLGVSVNAWAQAWPNRPVRIVVGYGPGSGADTLARIAAERLSEQLKTPFVVENRAGAAGAIATLAATKATPDGYTLLFGVVPLTITPHMQRQPSYNPVTDLTPIAKFAELNSVMVAPLKAPYKNLTELVAYAKANPGKLSYATSGKGSPSHLGIELIKKATRMDIRDVPYRDGGQAMADVISGQVDLFFAAISAAIPQIVAGKVTGIAIGAVQRSEQLPTLPTVAEQLGISNLEFTTWYGFLGPVGLPKEVVTRLGSELKAATESAEMRERVIKAGARVNFASPEAFAAEIKENSQRFGELVRELQLVE